MKFTGELGIAYAEAMREHLDRAIASTTEPALIVDLSEVRFIDSTAIGILMSAEKQLRGQGRQLKIVVGDNKNIERLLAITGLKRLFHKPPAPA